MKRIQNLKIGEFNTISTYNFEINKKSDFLITSYWWGRGNINRNSRENKTYDQLADRFINDCIKSKCNFFVAEIPDFAIPGGYQKAINYKPEYVINILKKVIPKNIQKVVYVDTDMRINKYPSLFNMKGYDFMGYNWNWEPRTMNNFFPLDCYDPYTLHTSGGLLMFANNQPSIELLEAWNEMVKRNPGKAEDRMLSIPFNDQNMITKLRCFWLPDEYFWLPYFFEYDDQFFVEKKYQKDFKKRGIKFKDNTTEEMSMTDFYNFQKKNIIISHPEMLTSEEMAAKQGADLNRVPMEWFKSQGRKKRCLTDLDKLVINPTLFLQNSQDYKQMEDAYFWLSESHFAKIENKELKIKEKQLSIFDKNITKEDIIMVTSLKKETNEDDIEEWLNLIEDHDYIILKKYSDLPSTLYTIMKKYKKDLLWVDISAKKTKNFENFDQIIQSDVDFVSLNKNSYPGYKGEKCGDDRFLNCPTTDILYFKNNTFGINILRVWKNIKDKVSDAQKLSKGFNKYGLILNTRVMWLNPGWMFNKKFITQRKGIEIILETSNPYSKTIKKSGLDDYLIQCGEKRPISTFELPYATHYKPSKYKKK